MPNLKEIAYVLNNEGIHKQCIVKIHKGKTIINNDYKKYITIRRTTSSKIK